MVSFGYTLSSEEHGPASSWRRPARPRRSASTSCRSRTTSIRGSARRATARSCGRCSARSPRRPTGSRSASGVTCPIVRIHPAVDRPGRGDDVAAVRGPVLPRRRHRRGAERAHPRSPLAPARGPPGDARGGRRRHPRRCGRATPSTTAATSTRSRTPGCSTRPTDVAADHRVGIRRRRRRLAARIGDGYWGHAPDARGHRPVRRARRQRARATPSSTCAGPTTTPTAARRPCTRCGPTAGSPASSSQDLPTWTHFEQAAELGRPRTTRPARCRAGPDPAPVLDSVRPVRRRRLRPPLLPPDRPRPGRLLPVLDRRAPARARHRRRAGSRPTRL